MTRITRSLTWLGFVTVALGCTLALAVGSSAAPAVPLAADFTFDKRVMLRAEYEATQSCAVSSDSLSVRYGAELVYCYLFTNIGSTTFVMHQMEDDKLGAFGPIVQEIAPGRRYGVIAIPPSPTTADITNTATWTATDQGGATIVRTDTVTVMVLTRQVFLPLVLR